MEDTNNIIDNDNTQKISNIQMGMEVEGTNEVQEEKNTNSNIDVNTFRMSQLKLPSNSLVTNKELGIVGKEYRKIMVPGNKLKSLKENWPTIVKAIIEHMKLEIRMNPKLRCIELRTSENTTNTSAMQRSEDFLKAYLCGFSLNDAIALLRLEDLYFETFDIKDVKSLKGDHLSRCIGRICGEKGKTKNAIENSTRTRVIVEGHKISLLGAHVNVGMARNAICSLILGSQPGKVYSQLRIMGKKLNEI
jgi:RNA-binding protein PNO1